MSALGQKRTFRSAIGMSALPPKADILQRIWVHFRQDAPKAFVEASRRAHNDPHR